jgi:hypothetical protein
MDLRLAASPDCGLVPRGTLAVIVSAVRNMYVCMNIEIKAISPSEDNIRAV